MSTAGRLNAGAMRSARRDAAAAQPERRVSPRRPVGAVAPVGLAAIAGIAFGLIAYADAAGIDQALRTGPLVWTCQNPW